MKSLPEYRRHRVFGSNYLTYSRYVLYSYYKPVTTTLNDGGFHMDAGLLLARITLGTLMAAHGAQKLFGWFGGYGLTATAGFFEGLGFRPGRLFAGAAAVSEVGSGVLLAIGFLEPVAAAVMLSVMIVAAV